MRTPIHHIFPTTRYLGYVRASGLLMARSTTTPFSCAYRGYGFATGALFGDGLRARVGDPSLPGGVGVRVEVGDGEGPAEALLVCDECVVQKLASSSSAAEGSLPAELAASSRDARSPSSPIDGVRISGE